MTQRISHDSLGKLYGVARVFGSHTNNLSTD